MENWMDMATPPDGGVKQISPDSAAFAQAIASSLVSQGEHALAAGRLSEGIDFFDRAQERLKPAPLSSQLAYREGVALLGYGSLPDAEQALRLSIKKFKYASSLDPKNPTILHMWGNALSLLGDFLGDSSILVLAQNKYDAVSTLEGGSAHLFWDTGLLWFRIGKLSNEPIDFRKSLYAFEAAKKDGDLLPSTFWVDYGESALSLLDVLQDNSSISIAIHCFRSSIREDPGSFEGWSGLAAALEQLYLTTHDEDLFCQANKCFASAIALEPYNLEQREQWATFLLSSGKRNGDLKKIRLAIEKCREAEKPSNPALLAILGEALSFLGEKTEQLALLQEGEEKGTEALELDEDVPTLWYRLGMTLCSFGAYFNDSDYYYQAIEKFQVGLSIDRTSSEIWHAMALAYTTAAQLDQDPEPLSQSLKFYEKTLAIRPTNSLYIDYAKALSTLGELTEDQEWFERALYYYELALSSQKNAPYLYPGWLFAYASTLDLMGDFHEEEHYYRRAIDLFSHVLIVDPDFVQGHHRIAQALCHLGDLLGETDYFYRAIHHLRLALKRDEDDDAMILDWGIILISISQHAPFSADLETLLFDAEQKLIWAAKLGNIQAYYHLSCLYSIRGEYEKSLYFLEKAHAFQALPPKEELLNDEWLEGLRSTEAFHTFIEHFTH